MFGRKQVQKLMRVVRTPYGDMSEPTFRAWEGVNRLFNQVADIVDAPDDRSTWEPEDYEIERDLLRSTIKKLAVQHEHVKFLCSVMAHYAKQTKDAVKTGKWNPTDVTSRLKVATPAGTRAAIVPLSDGLFLIGEMDENTPDNYSSADIGSAMEARANKALRGRINFGDRSPWTTELGACPCQDGVARPERQRRLIK